MATVLLCTEPFVPVAEREAKRNGLPDLPRLSLPGDLVRLTGSERRDLAERLVDAAFATLGQGRPEDR